jgi:hypothetical protein
MHLSSINSIYFEPNGSTTAAMAIAPSGNVGIGVNNPLYNLHVVSASSTSSLVVESVVNGLSYIRLKEGDTATYGFLGAYLQYDGNSNIFNLGVHDAADSNPANDFAAISILRSNGNVGINQTNPLSKLHVQRRHQSISFKRRSSQRCSIQYLNRPIYLSSNILYFFFTRWFRRSSPIQQRRCIWRCF